MMELRTIKLHNSLTGKKEIFEPLTPGRIGMYVCGPTVYSDVHLGNCRTFVSFDVIYRYLLFCGYKIRYVRNVTDVGHLLDDGEDRMSKGARVDQLEPMEVAQKYTVGFREMMRIFNTLPPSIEPIATGHIPEQIEMVEEIMKRGYGYERNGSVYFDVTKFAQENPSIYGQLSGRILEDLVSESRDNLKNQSEKNGSSDFAIWIKATEEHIMRWNSPWSVGFPGWHLECSAMSTKYLGKTFDIHGGGNDLKFPHHENEVAQNFGACGCTPARFWLHTNMLLLNGKKMSKSDGNTITPPQLFTGDSPFISKSYSPMAIRYFMLQAHYRSTLDITDEGLLSAEKGFQKLMEASKILQGLQGEFSDTETDASREVLTLIQEAHEGMDDDFNTAIALSKMQELTAYINKLANKQMSESAISAFAVGKMKLFFETFIRDVLGLYDETASGSDMETLDGLMSIILQLRADARGRKDFASSDLIRDRLNDLKIQIKDGKEGVSWNKG
jgi:cysteinyl-tRNA synthetase